MVAILDKIVLKELSLGGKCNLFHHGIVQDCLQKNNFTFCKGNLYGVIGEFGDGGAALSCGLTGNNDFYEGKIYIDEKETTIEELNKKSWYVGSELKSSAKLFRKKMTIREQITYGVNNYNTESDVQTIQSEFGISNERMDRSIEFVSGERWNASAAIGFANGKKLYCYPWLNTKDIEQLKEQLHRAVSFLLNAECIVIIPTTKEVNIKKINSEYNILNL